MLMVVMPLALRTCTRLAAADVAAAGKRVPMRQGGAVDELLRHGGRAHVVGARTVERVAAPALGRRARDHLAAHVAGRGQRRVAAAVRVPRRDGVLARRVALSHAAPALRQHPAPGVRAAIEARLLVEVLLVVVAQGPARLVVERRVVRLPARGRRRSRAVVAVRVPPLEPPTADRGRGVSGGGVAGRRVGRRVPQAPLVAIRHGLVVRGLGARVVQQVAAPRRPVLLPHGEPGIVCRVVGRAPRVRRAAQRGGRHDPHRLHLRGDTTSA